MKQNAYIAGVAMTRFGKYLERSLKSLAHEAISGALKDANIKKEALQAAWVGNVGAGIISGQVCVPGQVILRDMGIGKIPVIQCGKRLCLLSHRLSAGLFHGDAGCL